VQNLLVLCASQLDLRAAVEQQVIDHVQITARRRRADPVRHETHQSLGSRIGYYEGVGPARHGAEHMLQVLCVIASEPPWSLAPDVVRARKWRCYTACGRWTRRHRRVGGPRQYIRGESDGHEVPGDRKESATSTRR